MENIIYGKFMQVVNDYPEEPAVIENYRTMTFHELSDMVDVIAATFPDDVKAVGVVMTHRAEMIAAILAILKCGAMYIPAEPSFPVGRIHYMMDEADVDFVLTDMQFADRLEGLKTQFTDYKICETAKAKPERAFYMAQHHLRY